MILLPYLRFQLTSPLRIEEAHKRLSGSLEPKRAIRIWRSTDCKPYEGSIEGESFSIRRIINYRNSFLPVIKGELSSRFGSTVIRVQMHPHVLTLGLMAVWLGGMGLIFLFSLYNYLTELAQKGPYQSQTAQALAFPMIMFLFGYVMMVLAFHFEAQKSKSFFKELFEAEETGPDDSAL